MPHATAGGDYSSDTHDLVPTINFVSRSVDIYPCAKPLLNGPFPIGYEYASNLISQQDNAWSTLNIICYKFNSPPGPPSPVHRPWCTILAMTGIYILCLLVLAVHRSHSTSTASSPLDVLLRTGTFRGVSTTTGIEQWLGLPYALPPTGSLRFKAPVPVPRASSATKDASEFGNACPQRPGNLGAPMSEDCLFLNVQHGPITNPSAKLNIGAGL
jgi:hypothetical protein